MNNLQIFNSDEFGEIRTVLNNETPMFCLSDVCKALGLSQPSKVKERLNQKGVNSIPTLTKGGMQNLLYIDESNLYKTIFQSRKESAERFTDWVTSEVLPSIRKHGVYAIDQLLDNPELAIKAFTALKEEREKNKLLAEENKRMRPKEIFADAVASSKQSILIGQLARFDSTSKKILPGKFLMEDALNRIDCIHKEIGLRFIWLDCEDNPKLKKFYEGFGFTEVNNDRYCQMMAFFEEHQL